MSMFSFLLPVVLAAAVAGDCSADDTCFANVYEADDVGAMRTELLQVVAPQLINAGETTKVASNSSANASMQPFPSIGGITGAVTGAAGNAVGGVVNSAVQPVINTFVNTVSQAINSSFATVNTAVNNYSAQLQAMQTPLVQSASSGTQSFVSQLSSTFGQAMTGYNQIPWSMLNVQAASALLPSQFSVAVSALIAFNATLANSSQIISSMSAAGSATAMTQLTQLNGTLQTGLTNLSNACDQVKSAFQSAISSLSTTIVTAIPANVAGVDLSAPTSNLAGLMTVAGGNLNTTVDNLYNAVAGFANNGVGQAISAFSASGGSAQGAAEPGQRLGFLAMVAAGVLALFA